MKKILLIILLLPLLGNAQITLVKDNFQQISAFMQYKNQIFFYAYDGTNEGLWKTDGTTAGTVFVKTIYNTIEFSGARQPAISGGLLYFTDGGGKLWRTDGTSNGTFELTSNLTTFVFNKIDLNGILIFTGRDADGDELWRTDGTLAGTYKIVDFNLGASSGVSGPMYNMAKQGSYIYFAGVNASFPQNTLCRTDGTGAGTQVVSNAGFGITDLAMVGDKIVYTGRVNYTYYAVNTSGTTTETYPSSHKSIMKVENGVASVLKNPGTYYAGNYPTGPYIGPQFGNDFNRTEIFRKSGNKLFFNANSYPSYSSIDNSNALWVTDGNSSQLLKIFPNVENTGNPIEMEPWYWSRPVSTDLSFLGNIFYFVAKDNATGYEVWRSDGTVAGTFLLKDIYAGAGASDPIDFRTVNGLTYFIAHDGTKRKLFQTDGTTAGTVPVSNPLDVNPYATELTSDNNSNKASNAIGSKFLFVGTQANISGTGLFSVCTTPIAPVITSNTSSTICAGSSTTLTATGCTGSVSWSTGATTSAIIVNPTANTTYTSACNDVCGTSPSSSITINVNPLPTVPTLSQTGTQVVCPNTNINLTASSCNGSLLWSNGATTSAIIVNSAGTYNATCTNTCGTSIASSSFVLAYPNLTQSLSSVGLNGTTKAIQTISSTQNINNSINSTYLAGKSITLNPNFTANSGSIFKAEIGNACPITNGLVLHLPFDGNTNDISGGNNNGTASNATLTTDQDGKPNSAYYFNGNNAYISVPNNPSFSGNTELTLSAWIRPEDLNGTYRGIITKWFQNASSDTYAILLANTNQILAAVKGNPEIFSGMISANNWIQVVYTHSLTVDKIFINGVLVSTSNVSVGMSSSTIPIIIGADSNNGTIWRFFKGKIDEVKIYNRALTIQEIEYQYAYESIPTNINTGLVAHYNMNNNVDDQSGNGHNTTYTNTTVTTGRKGDANGAYSFNGINQRINLGTWFNLQQFTISMWLNTGSTQANAYAMIFDNNHGGNLMWNMQQRNTTLNLYDFGLSGSPGTGQSFNLTPNQWTHIVITCNGSTLSLYKDGVLSGSSTYTGPIIYNGTQSLCLGTYVNGGNYVRYWNGKMDDIKIYNRAVSDVEVIYLYSE